MEGGQGTNVLVAAFWTMELAYSPKGIVQKASASPQPEKA